MIVSSETSVHDDSLKATAGPLTKNTAFEETDMSRAWIIQRHDKNTIMYIGENRAGGRRFRCGRCDVTCRSISSPFVLKITINDND